MKQPPNLPKGVLLAPNGTYYVRLNIAKKTVYFRGFATPEEAAEVYQRVRAENPKTGKPTPRKSKKGLPTYVKIVKGKYVSYAKHKLNRFHVGTFDTVEAAVTAQKAYLAYLDDPINNPAPVGAKVGKRAVKSMPRKPQAKAVRRPKATTQPVQLQVDKSELFRRREAMMRAIVGAW